MGFYGEYILPRVINLVMQNKETARLRAAWIPKAQGKVLEIGIGSGLNLPFYSAEVTRIYGLEPCLSLQQMARKRARATTLKVDFFTQSAEESVPLDAGSMDTVVFTWTLCSIPKPSRALAQAKRVLKPAGHLIFVEHGRAPTPGVASWQDRMTPIWRRIGGGCHLNRLIESLITEAGFRITQLKKDYLPGPRLMTYTYQGVAEPASNSA